MKSSDYITAHLENTRKKIAPIIASDLYYISLMCFFPWCRFYLKYKNMLEVRRTVLGVHWKDWCWSGNSNTLATWCEELTHLKRPWCWERLRAGGEGDDRGWDGWMASPTQWTWGWVDSRSWWRTGRPGVLQFIGSQKVGYDWVTELNWLIIDTIELTEEWRFGQEIWDV